MWKKGAGGGTYINIAPQYNGFTLTNFFTKVSRIIDNKSVRTVKLALLSSLRFFVCAE